MIVFVHAPCTCTIAEYTPILRDSEILKLNLEIEVRYTCMAFGFLVMAQWQYLKVTIH